MKANRRYLRLTLWAFGVALMLVITFITYVEWQRRRWPTLEHLDTIVAAADDLAASYHARRLPGANGRFHGESLALEDISREHWPVDLVSALQPFRPIRVRVNDDGVYVWLAASRGEGWGFQVKLSGKISVADNELPSTGHPRVRWFVSHVED